MTRAPLAADPARSRGRLHREDDRTNRGPRDAFQRDRDRIIHSIPFRRLRHKTQVFVAPDGDHYRVRLTHSLEVAQIARTLARALGLNEDLTEALALAHDIGHPPFGHAGEDVLQAAMAAAGGFDHNAHTIRLLTRLETPYPGSMASTSWETLEGLAKHNGPVAGPTWALAEADACGRWSWQLAGRWRRRSPRSPTTSPMTITISTTACAPACSRSRNCSTCLGARGLGGGARAPSGVDEARLVPELVRDLIGRMVNDVLDETRAPRRGVRRRSGRGGPRRRPPARRLLGRHGGRGARAQGLPPRPHVRRALGEGGARRGAAHARRLCSTPIAPTRAVLPPEWRPADPAFAPARRSATSSPA